jgi:prevent-host-death family protein
VYGSPQHDRQALPHLAPTAGGDRSGRVETIAPGRCDGRIEPSHWCYSCRMGEAASRELRNNTRGLLDRVEAGEAITITLDGRPVALLQPLGRRPQWLGREEFVRRVVRHQADSGLANELGELAPGTTDDLALT